MQEMKTTVWFVTIAAILVILAVLMAPRRITPDAFLDQGEPFFPEFTNPNDATTLEVIEFDPERGQNRPFRVTFANGRWTIPSHHDYPADAADRLAKTAAGVIDLKKDDFRSNTISDQLFTGVLDPLDETAGLTGRGTRVTLKKNEQTLADLIIGYPVEGRPGFRYVRVPGSNRIYASRVDVDLSTRFADWIDTDLLQVVRRKIDQVAIDNYRVDERTRSVQQLEKITLNKGDDGWRTVGTKAEPDSAVVAEMLATLDTLTIVGVRPKPAGLSASLKADAEGGEIDHNTVFSLRDKGFFIGADGHLVSNEGEMVVRTTDKVYYTLRFGEVVYGSGLEISAGLGAEDPEGQSTQDVAARYLFVTTRFDKSELPPEPPQPTDREFQSKPDSLWTAQDSTNSARHNEYQVWQAQVERGERISRELNERFADWYYVISEDSFRKLKIRRADLTP
jgi:hypothetical protein